MSVVRSTIVVLVAVLPVACSNLTLSSQEREYFWRLESDSMVDFETEEVCRVHRVPTVIREVPVQDGMCVEAPRYMKARVRRFPNSFLAVSSCFCESIGPEIHVVRWVCPVCRQAELDWRARHDG